MVSSPLDVLPCQPEEFRCANASEGLNCDACRHPWRRFPQHLAQLGRCEDLNLRRCAASPLDNGKQVNVPRKPAASLAEPEEGPQHQDLIVEAAWLQLEFPQVIGHVLRGELADFDVKRLGKTSQPVGDVPQIGRTASRCLLLPLEVPDGIGHHCARDASSVVPHEELRRFNQRMSLQRLPCFGILDCRRIK
jgi:hypothetical protein